MLLVYVVTPKMDNQAVTSPQTRRREVRALGTCCNLRPLDEGPVVEHEAVLNGGGAMIDISDEMHMVLGQSRQSGIH